ncbi:MAG: GNAT family protein [Candidatus Edwardsbacteria bacterium]
MQNPFIIGGRIYLRAIEMKDLETFLCWFNDSEVREFLATIYPLNEIREREFIEKCYQDKSWVILNILLKEKNLLIGNMSLMRIDWVHRQAEFGICIGEKGYWNKGYGTEATKLLLKYGFDTLNLHRIYLFVYEWNQRGIKCYEKAGFKIEAILRGAKFKDGRYFNVVLMSILRDEWTK